MAKRTFSPTLDRESCLGCAAACIDRCRSVPRRESIQDLTLRGDEAASQLLFPHIVPPFHSSLWHPHNCALFYEPLLNEGFGVSMSSTCTSQPFEVGIPVPSVLPPMSLQVGGP